MVASQTIALTASESGDYIRRNRAAWDRWAPNYRAPGREAWQDDQLRWGIWEVPEDDLRLLERMSDGVDVLELGCGAGALCAWLARNGARPVGVDFSRAQLETAEALQHEYGIGFRIAWTAAEELTFDDASFDLVISEYGPSLWSDPDRWLREASRVLRPGGELIFFTSGALLMVCTPVGGGHVVEWLTRDYFAPARTDFPVESVTEFHLPHGAWVSRLRANGFLLHDLVEIQPPPGAVARFDFVTVEWARRWSSEEIWIARKSG